MQDENIANYSMYPIYVEFEYYGLFIIISLDQNDSYIDGIITL